MLKIHEKYLEIEAVSLLLCKLDISEIEEVKGQQQNKSTLKSVLTAYCLRAPTEAQIKA